MQKKADRNPGGLSIRKGQWKLFIPETTLRPGVLGLELTSRTSVSSEVLPTPEQLSSSCRRSSCFRSGVSVHQIKR